MYAFINWHTFSNDSVQVGRKIR